MTKDDPFIRIIFELMPVFFAALAFVYCSLQISKQEKYTDKLFFTMACVNAVLMTLAQISWTWTVYVGDTVGTLLSDYTWTIFNTLVMVSYLVATNKTPTDKP
jgi:hypothetical protein